MLYDPMMTVTMIAPIFLPLVYLFAIGIVQLIRDARRSNHQQGEQP